MKARDREQLEHQNKEIVQILMLNRIILIDFDQNEQMSISLYSQVRCDEKNKRLNQSFQTIWVNEIVQCYQKENLIFYLKEVKATKKISNFV